MRRDSLGSGEDMGVFNRIRNRSRISDDVASEFRKVSRGIERTLGC